jgi:hypothetical protein
MDIIAQKKDFEKIKIPGIAKLVFKLKKIELSKFSLNFRFDFHLVIIFHLREMKKTFKTDIDRLSLSESFQHLLSSLN